MKGATFEENEEVAQALLDGKPENEVLETRGVMIQKHLQSKCAPTVELKDGQVVTTYPDTLPAGVP